MPFLRHLKRTDPDPAPHGREGQHALENRWCDRWGYFIDIAACEARAGRRPFCRRCVNRWRQGCFPFFENS